MSDTEGQRERIAQLLGRRRELESALSELDHQARRLGDRVERDGATTPASAAEQRRLERNRRLNREELDQVRAELRRLGSDAE